MNEKCNICGNDKQNEHYCVEERMYNLKENFDYLKCRKCGTMQLNEKVQEAGKYYQKKYGGFLFKEPSKSSFKLLIDKCLAFFIVNLPYSIGDILINQGGRLAEEYGYLASLAGTKLKKANRILDVGCGSGQWLYRLKRLGYKDIQGIDLFYDNKNGKCNILKGTIFSLPLTEKYDLITFHHSFEHMENPVDILNNIYQLLNKNGSCIIRIPVMDKYAWHKYKTNWVQIDAPRHLFLYTEKALRYLCHKTGFQIYKIIYDSTYFQFSGSELYLKKKVSLNRQGIVDADIKKKYVKIARKLNKASEGDQAIFYLKKLVEE